jgi:hypothetical protein
LAASLTARVLGELMLAWGPVLAGQLLRRW